MHKQPFASPEEALEHYGIKGMRWGHRKQEDSGSRDSSSKEDDASYQSRMLKDLGIKRAPDISPYTTGNATRPRSESKTESKDEDRKGLSSNQKTAIAVGVGVVGVAGYVAYRHYTKSGGVPPVFDVEGLADRPLSKKNLGMLGHGTKRFELDDIDSLMVDTSKGYANFIPKGGLNAEASARHRQLMETFEEMREKYPAVRNLNVEMVPMSHVSGAEDLITQKCPAAVQAIRPGEARILYNDLTGKLSKEELAYVKEWQPGVMKKKYLGYHEMGHILAVAHGDLAPSFDLVERAPDFFGSSEGSFRQVAAHQRRYQAWTKYKNERHKQLFKKHGFTFEELGKLSKYSATEPAEALAELTGHFFTPEYRKQMSPDMARRAEALINEMGGIR